MADATPLLQALGGILRKLQIISLIVFCAGCALDRNHTIDAVHSDFGQIGLVRLGMSQAQIEGAIGVKISPGYTIPAEEQSCYYLRSKEILTGIGFMMDHDRLVRYDVWESAIRTSTGIGIGSTQSDVETAYGLPITVSPHKYADGRYLVVDGADNLKLLFETDASGVITMYRSGREPEVSYVEGCL